MKLCVSIAEPTLERACAAALAVDARGAFAEIRLDALDDVRGLTVERLEPVCPGTPRVLTFRASHDGGRHDVDDAWRVRLLVGAAARFGVRIDVEHEHLGLVESGGLDPSRLIVSHHDFESTPADLGGLFDRMRAPEGATVKIATVARGVADLFAHAELLAQAPGRLVAIPMGEFGTPLRILGPALGAPFTYCSARSDGATAPGQVDLDAMLEIYLVEAITASTVVNGLVAGSTVYSRSPRMHNLAARDLGLDMVYLPFKVDDIAAFIAGIRTSGWPVAGLSVTNPWKTAVVELLDDVDALAARVGAVNTIVVDRDGRLIGRNTDVEGAMRPLERMVRSLRGRRVAVLGAGGAARAVVCGLVDRGAVVTVVARRPERAERVAASFGVAHGGLDGFDGAGFDAVVNATPVGTSGVSEGESPIAAGRLRGAGVVFDLVYKPERTRLLEDAEAMGCRTLGGLPMLAEQAALQFEAWTGSAIDPARMLDFAR